MLCQQTAIISVLLARVSLMRPSFYTHYLIHWQHQTACEDDEWSHHSWCHGLFNSGPSPWCDSHTSQLQFLLLLLLLFILLNTTYDKRGAFTDLIAFSPQIRAMREGAASQLFERRNRGSKMWSLDLPDSIISAVYDLTSKQDHLLRDGREGEWNINSFYKSIKFSSQKYQNL